MENNRQFSGKSTCSKELRMSKDHNLSSVSHTFNDVVQGKKIPLNLMLYV